MKQGSKARARMRAKPEYKTSISLCKKLVSQVNVKKDPKLPKPLKRLNVFDTRVHQVLSSENIQIKVELSVSHVGQTYHTFETGGLKQGETSKPQTLYSVHLESFMPNGRDWPGTTNGSSIRHTTPEHAMYYAYKSLLSNMRYQKELGIEDSPFTEKEIKDYVAGLIATMHFGIDSPRLESK
ncbi:hypothetical protein BN7874_022 [Phage NCTB]|nr:hypothetical protein BN7874_022 [Phage NCTB]